MNPEPEAVRRNVTGDFAITETEVVRPESFDKSLNCEVVVECLKPIRQDRPENEVARFISQEPVKRTAAVVRGEPVDRGRCEFPIVFVGGETIEVWNWDAETFGDLTPSCASELGVEFAV